MDIKVPNLGDIDEVEVIEIHVSAGDVVGENDTLIVIESDKASMDVPAGTSGTVGELTVAIGDMVSEGSVIARLEPSASENKEPSASEGKEPSASENKEPSASDNKEPSASEAQKSSAPAAAQELDILVPDIGDASGVVVIEIAVQAGQVVAVDDLLVVVESDKASMEITSEYAGEIIELLVTEDQEVEQGTLIARIKADVGAPEVAETSAISEAVEAPAASAPVAPTPVSESRTQVSATPASESTVNVSAKVYAGPATRRLARELGVDLAQIAGSGSRGRVIKDDVKTYVKNQMSKGPDAGAGGGLPEVADIDFARFGEVELIDLTRIRQRGADNLHRSWVNLPHVTQHDEVDITDLEAFRKSLKAEAESRGVRLTPLSFLVKTCARALQEFPEFNSSLHKNRKQLVLKQYINIGMAVDTPEGLVVPVIKDAAGKDIWQISQDIIALSQKARDKKLGMDDLSGGTFSISSLGALGGTGFTPIVNAPEVAILGVAKLQTKPVWQGSEFVPRQVLPLSLSYDHRVINGADGGRFMVRLTELLGDIRHLALV